MAQKSIMILIIFILLVIDARTFAFARAVAQLSLFPIAMSANSKNSSSALLAAGLPERWSAPAPSRPPEERTVTSNKTIFSSVKMGYEIGVDFSIAETRVLIKSTHTDKKKPTVDLDLPYSSIDAISYQPAARRRWIEGVVDGAVFTPAVGAVVAATKNISHWLAIEYRDKETKQVAILRLDKSEYRNLLSALAARSGKNITSLNANTRSLILPASDSRNVDELVPYGTERIAAALKPAMESQGCKVTKEKSNQIECKRPFLPWGNNSERTGSGGEKVTARFNAKGGKTRVRIWTGKGFVGRWVKKNWSTPIYQEMLKNLEKQD
ncbi:MAG: hypothetical protein QUT30_13885 [Acidobacteriota bacterium]|nr:hypothetical protein [Acidobacteriota bacterium]